MLKSIIFTGEPNTYSWNGTVSESADEKFNRWMKDHPHINVKGINYAIDGSKHSICVMYDDMDEKEHISVIEDGRYYVDTYNGRFIMCDRNLDVSYMIKNFTGFYDIMTSKTESTCIVDLVNGKFIRKLKASRTKDMSDGGPIYYEEACEINIPAHYVIHDKYIPGYGTAGDNVECYSLRKNTGEYYVDISKSKLIRCSDKLDVSYIVGNFYGFTKMNIDYDGEVIVCMGDTFKRINGTSKKVNKMDDNDIIQIRCEDVIHHAYL